MKSIGDLVKDQQVLTAEPGTKILDVVELMKERGIGAVPVVKDGELVGIFSERDLLTKVVSQCKDADEQTIEKITGMTVGEVMTKELVIANYADTCDECLKKMQLHGIRHLPVVAEGELIGIISIRDLLLCHLVVKEEELDLLNTFINFVPPSMSSVKEPTFREQTKNPT